MSNNSNHTSTVKESDFFQEETLNASAANLAPAVNLEAFEPKIADKSSEGPSVSAAALGSMTAENAASSSTQIKSNILGQKKVTQTKKVIYSI